MRAPNDGDLRRPSPLSKSSRETPANVKLLLPPRQSRGISLFISGRQPRCSLAGWRSHLTASPTKRERVNRAHSMLLWSWWLSERRFRGLRRKVRAFVLLDMYIAYLDEFGHVGPYVSKAGPKYDESPVFGLGGMILPAEQVRHFATWFYQLKSRLLAWEIERSGEPAHSWEKKGAQLYTTKNVLTYPEVRKATYRLLNHLHKIGGTCVYVGLEKYTAPSDHNANGLYLSVLHEVIKRIDLFAERSSSDWLLIMDEHPQRDGILSEASKCMFGVERRTHLMEPPIQAESHRFQTLQCADWICGLVGRLGAFVCRPDDYPDLSWTRTYFQERVNSIAPFSAFRRRPIDVEGLFPSSC